MISFIIKSIICLAILYAFYRILLERKKMSHFNRFYLLSIIIFSLIIPNLILFTESPIVTPFNQLPNISSSTLLIEDYQLYIIAIYIIVSFILIIKFISGLVSIITKTRKNELIKMNQFILVLMDEKVLPHTFLNYVFINKEDYKSQVIADELLTHEMTHAKEKHSFDIIFIEFIHCLFWFNPIIILIKRSIRLNHEFIADEVVLSVHNNRPVYQHILLEIGNWKFGNNLASGLNYGLMKKRFKMMVKRNSQLSKNLSKLSIIPLIILVILLFSNFSSQNSEEREHSSEHRSMSPEEEHHDEDEYASREHKSESKQDSNQN